MKRLGLAAIAASMIGALVGCNAERQQECDKFLGAMKPLEQSVPTAEAVGRAHDALAAIRFDDEPLREYAKNAAATLTVLSTTLTLQADPSAPDGTNDVVKEKLKEAQGERDDVARYCLP